MGVVLSKTRIEFDGEPCLTNRCKGKTYSLMVSVVVIGCSTKDKIVCEEVGRKSNNGDSEPREYTSEHHALLEDGTMAPGFPFCPWISKKRKVGHCRAVKECEGKMSEQSQSRDRPIEDDLPR